MSLQTEIKKTITLYSKKYYAKRVYKIEEAENMLGEITLWIEVSVRKKRKHTIKK